MTRPNCLSTLTTAIAVLSVSLFCLGRAAIARADDEKPIKALFICGGCCHDYAKQKDIITKGISARANVEWTIAYDPDNGTTHLNPVYDNADWSKGYDVVLHDECSADVKDLATIDRILKPHRDGLPAVVIHCGMHCYRSAGWPEKVTPWFEFTGMQTTGHGAQLPIEIHFTDKESPITKGIERLDDDPRRACTTTSPTNRCRPLTLLPPARKARTRRSSLGRTNTTARPKSSARRSATTMKPVADPRYLDLVTRGLLWSVGKLDDAHFKAVKVEPSGK